MEPAEQRTVPSPPPPPPGETPAGERFRKNFQPVFMRLKQPEVPGIWGSWDPAPGPQRDSGSRDWPEYDRTLVKPGEGLDAASTARDTGQESSQAVAPAKKGQMDPNVTIIPSSRSQEATSVLAGSVANQSSSGEQDSSALAELYGIGVDGPQQLDNKSRDPSKTGPGWFPFGLWSR